MVKYQKNNLLIFLGFSIFAVEILLGFAYGLTFVPWNKLSFLIGIRAMCAYLLILWNIAGVIFIYFGYRWDEKR